MQAIQASPMHESRVQVEKIYLHPLPVRIWHWVNALGFVLLIMTGMQIRYADLFSVMTFESSINVHNWIGFAVLANYFLWLGYHLTSDRISNYHPVLNAREFFENYYHQTIYYSYGIFKGEKRPHKVQPLDKFNPMQRLTYQFVMMITAPLQILTGLMMWDVKRFEGLIELAGGIRVVSTIHVLLCILFVFFILVHAYMGVLGAKPSTHYKEMITGYEEPGDH
jgi:thiosulfate reductase cytochrome b subunit